MDGLTKSNMSVPLLTLMNKKVIYGSKYLMRMHEVIRCVKRQGYSIARKSFGLYAHVFFCNFNGCQNDNKVKFSYICSIY